MDLKYNMLYVLNEGKAAVRRGAAVAQRFVAADTAAENSIYRRADDENASYPRERGMELNEDEREKERVRKKGACDFSFETPPPRVSDKLGVPVAVDAAAA